MVHGNNRNGRKVEDSGLKEMLELLGTFEIFMVLWFLDSSTEFKMVF